MVKILDRLIDRGVSFFSSLLGCSRGRAGYVLVLTLLFAFLSACSILSTLEYRSHGKARPLVDISQTPSEAKKANGTPSDAPSNSPVRDQDISSKRVHS